MSGNTILTIGYEGATIDDFVASLVMTQVETLIDIREVPLSRKTGFSKTALAKRVEEAGIAYVYLGHALGDPKEGRDAARRGDKAGFEKIFRQRMAEDDAQQALVTAMDFAKRSCACLLCFERKADFCHRHIVAEEMAARMGVNIKHMGVREKLAEIMNSKEFKQRYAAE